MRDFLNKVKSKFPYAYSIIPQYTWEWIYNNIIIKEWK